jgi:[protein-PII] uridylyltransferase
MNDYLDRTRAALRSYLKGRPADAEATAAPAVSLGDNLLLVNGRVRFEDPTRIVSDPCAWLGVFEAAIAHDAGVADDALANIERAAGGYPRGTCWSTDDERQRWLHFFRPRPGLAMRLKDMSDCGLLGRLLTDGGTSATPDATRTPVLDAHALLAVQKLESLSGEATLSGERFGAMLRELHEPELLVLALLCHHAGASKHEHHVEQALVGAQPVLDALQLPADARQMVEFLIRNQLQMSQLAFRQDIADPDVVGTFATLLQTAALFSAFSTEEHLKMLCLMTVADLGAMGDDALTPWKAELLWRLFVDTYNQLTMAYGDEVIDANSAARTTLHVNRPADVAEAELTRFLEGLPTRYLTLFDPDSIYQHVRLWRDMRPDDVHFFLGRKGDLWELTVVTQDKPYLFSNICGVLSYLGMDILRGQALTSLNALVLDVFQFRDRMQVLEDGRALTSLLSDVVAGRVDILSQLRAKERSAALRVTASPPVLYFDNDLSQRYTILEVVADDSPGLLHRVSRVISAFGCEVELVLISTDGPRAVDVFHLRKAGAKLSDPDQLALTELLESMMDEGSA